jgi:hypothetical protein
VLHTAHRSDCHDQISYPPRVGWSVCFLVRTRKRNCYITNRAGAVLALVILFSGTLMPKGLLLFKEADLRRAIRTFQKLGLPIARAEIERDGKIVVVTGNNSEQPEQSDKIIL